MANFNKVILAGNLTRDPQLSYLPSGTPVCEIGMAINRRWKAQQTGETREETTFVDCRAFGRQAETLNQYMQKGRPLMVEGRLKFDSWEGKDGQKRSKITVVVENFQFLGSAPGGGAGGGGGRGSSNAGYGGGQDDSGPPIEEPAPSGGEDIPF